MEASPAFQESTLTIVLTDIEGSTAMTERLGDAAWVDLLRLHNEIIRDRVSRHGGREAAFNGDGFTLVFEQPVDAARCAISIQRMLSDVTRRYSTIEIPVRVAVHHGPVLEEHDAVVGTSLRLAEQVMGVAHGGEILVTPGFRGLVAREALEFDHPRQLNGVCGVHSAFPLRWRPSPVALVSDAASSRTRA